VTPTTINVACFWHPGGHDIDGWATLTPGLALHAFDGCELPGGATWHVCHVASGATIVTCDGPEGAAHIVSHIAGLVDWTIAADRPLLQCAVDDARRLAVDLGGNAGLGRQKLTDRSRLGRALS